MDGVAERQMMGEDSPPSGDDPRAEHARFWPS